MDTFVFSYRMPAEYVPGTEDAVADWTAWFSDIQGSIADTGRPVFERTSLGECGDATRLGGYTLVTADSLEAATLLAKGCPLLTRGGGVEVGKLGEVPAVEGSPR